jgi:hypothetical protein
MIVRRVSDQDSAFLRFAERHDLTPGQTVQVEERDAVADSVTRAAAATDFAQRDPDNGAPATEAIEVRIVYDDDRLIFGVILHDNEPSRAHNHVRAASEEAYFYAGLAFGLTFADFRSVGTR